MRKEKVKIYATDWGNKKDEKKAKLLEDLINSKWNKYEPVIERLLAIYDYMKVAYDVDVPQQLLEKVMAEVIRLEISYYHDKK